MWFEEKFILLLDDTQRLTTAKTDKGKDNQRQTKAKTDKDKDNQRQTPKSDKCGLK